MSHTYTILEQHPQRGRFLQSGKTTNYRVFQEKYIIICNDFNAHKSAELIKLVAEECVLPKELGIKKKEDILKSKKKYLTSESHLRCFVYTTKHNSWVNQIETWFEIITRKFLKKSVIHQ